MTTPGAAPETQPQSESAFRAEVASIRDAPFTTGETQEQRDGRIEEIYKKRFGTAEVTGAVQIGPSQQQEQTQDEEHAEGVQWGDSPDQQVSEADGMLRQAIGKHLMQSGFSTDEASRLVGLARGYYARKAPTEEQKHEAELELQRTLRRAWGTEYEKNLDAAEEFLNAFADNFPHGDLEKALENGLLLDPAVVMLMAKAGLRQAAFSGSIEKINEELPKHNEGSVRWKQLMGERERLYKQTYGTGPA